MNPGPGAVAIASTGLVTSVGLSAPAACAAIRAGVMNPTETRFMDSEGEWIMAHSVPLEQPWRGRAKLVKMASMALAECLAVLPRERWSETPVLLCVAEPDRPGRLEGIDQELLTELQEEMGTTFGPGSGIVAHGRVGAAVALLNARHLLQDRSVSEVAILATDTFLVWPTLASYEDELRLLTSTATNAFIPGEGAGGLLVRRPSGRAELLCTGLGFSVEKVHIRSEEPLRGDGLTKAIRTALLDARCEMHQLDFRITDIAGEQYYFKEASLAVSRLLRQLKEEFDIWHPADCIGETGATAGVAMIAVAEAAARKGYAPGSSVLLHMANDGGERAAAVLRAAQG